MKNKVLLTASSIFILASCNVEEINYEPSTPTTLTNIETVEVSSNGYLTFANAITLEQYMDSISNKGTSLSKKLCTNGFKSIANLQDELSARHAIMKKSSIDSEENEDENMTEDEFNLMKAEDLLFDNKLTYIMDTTLRVCVDGILYKITQYGTFSAQEKDASKIEQAIINFDTTLLYQSEIGDIITLPNGVNFIRSFNNQQENTDNNDDLVEERKLSKDFAINTFHTSYNVDSYKWKNHSLFQKLVDLIRGKQVSREKKFSKSKRVQLILFEVNYGFYASTGVKVKVQKRKKFLGIPYWKATSAEKIAIGFNGLEGELKYDNPRNYSKISPTTSSYYGSFTATFNKMSYNFIYTKISNVDFLRDWINNTIYCILPAITINNTNVTTSLVNSLYAAETKEIANLPKLITNQYIFDPIKKQIKPKDPMIAYLFWGNSTTTYNKERPYVTGVEEYNDESKSVIFDRSYGITISNKIIKGFTPTKFDIKNIDVFGAAYCDGQWMGLRFYYED